MSGTNPRANDLPGWVISVLAFVRRTWGTISITIGSILLAAAGAPELFLGSRNGIVAQRPLFEFSWEPPQVAFVLGIVFTLAGLIRQVSLRPSYNQLLQSRNAARTHAVERAGAAEGVLRAILVRLADSLDLNSSTIRLSVYCHEQSEFVLLSRMSADPALKVRGRNSYPDSQGVIGKAWKLRTAALVDLPEDYDAWQKQLAINGIDEDTASKLSMRSRSLIGVRIDADEGGEQVPVGVLVLESTKPRGVNGKTVDKLRTDDTWQVLVHAMYNARHHFPGVARALVAEPAIK